jgi:hypothetical protein
LSTLILSFHGKKEIAMFPSQYGMYAARDRCNKIPLPMLSLGTYIVFQYLSNLI